VARRPLLAGAVSGLLALAVYLLGPPAIDAAAHQYQVQFWREHGWRLWDNFWYAGRYSQVNYSLLFYPLAALLGTVTMVALSVAGAAAAFGTLIRRQWPSLATGPVVAFTLLAPLGAVAGTYPFLLGLALALGALVALQSDRLMLCVGATLLTALAHPLALVFLLLVMAGLAVTSRGWWREPRKRRLAAALAAVGLLQIALLRAFAAEGARYPFGFWDAVAIAIFCTAGLLLTRGVPDQRPLRGLFAGYAALAAVTFLVASPIGGNVGRLLLLMGVPLLLLPLGARGFRPRGIAVACLATALFWQALPAVGGFRQTSGARAASEEFWYPVMAFLDRHHDPNYRVEVVATADHSEAYYLAGRGVPLARGWYRQDDWPENAALYRRLTPARYLAWMRRMGVRYVLLPDDPLDYSAKGEARLLRTRSPLPVRARYGGWTIYELPEATPIATPASRISVRSLTAGGIALYVDRPGRYRLRLRYTPYWRVVGGGACVAPRSPWGTELRASRAGLIRVRFDVTLGRMARAVLGDRGGCASPPRQAAGRAF
jgi:hypothetical protein